MSTSANGWIFASLTVLITSSTPLPAAMSLPIWSTRSVERALRVGADVDPPLRPLAPRDAQEDALVVVAEAEPRAAGIDGAARPDAAGHAVARLVGELDDDLVRVPARRDRRLRLRPARRPGAAGAGAWRGCPRSAAARGRGSRSPGCVRAAAGPAPGRDRAGPRPRARRLLVLGRVEARVLAGAGVGHHHALLLRVRMLDPARQHAPRGAVAGGALERERLGLRTRGCAGDRSGGGALGRRRLAIGDVHRGTTVPGPADPGQPPVRATFPTRPPRSGTVG